MTGQNAADGCNCRDDNKSCHIMAVLCKKRGWMMSEFGIQSVQRSGIQESNFVIQCAQSSGVVYAFGLC